MTEVWLPESQFFIQESVISSHSVLRKEDKVNEFKEKRHVSHTMIKFSNH